MRGQKSKMSWFSVDQPNNDDPAFLFRFSNTLQFIDQSD